VGEIKAKSRATGNTVLRRRLLIAGLAAFLIFDVALVSFALNAPASKTTAPVAKPAATPTPKPVATPTPTPKPVETKPPVVEPVETKPPTRILTALNASTAWRAATGACPTTTANPELTTDAGATWTKYDASAGTNASSILSIYVTSKAEASLVTLSTKNCTPQRVSTFVAGEQWKDYPDRVGANWFVDPANRAVVHSPVGAFPAPCPAVIALANRTDSTAAVLCSDGRLFRTGDGAATWGPGVPLPGAANLTSGDNGYLIVAANQAGCAGAQVLSTPEAPDGALSVKGCRAAAFTPGNLAVANAGGIVWLWAGDALSRSSDGGTTWQ
jgi:hypothetical protein